MPSTFANHLEVTIIPVLDSTNSGCEDTVDGCYIPSTATVDVGNTVIFLNSDITAHTFTAGTEGWPSNEFDTGLLMTGDSIEYYPDTIGEIPYMCTIHPWMEGLIIVQNKI